MGLVVLHSGHLSKPFTRLMGTSCNLRWREADDRELVWTVEPGAPDRAGRAAGVRDRPRRRCTASSSTSRLPTSLCSSARSRGGEVFRSGCCFLRGKGRIFFFSPGHEHFPVYHHADVQRVIANAVLWARVEQPSPVDTSTCVESPTGWFERAGMTSFRIAVVGAGSISRFWLPILRDRRDVDVVALVDVDAEVARAAAERDGVSAPIFRHDGDGSRGDGARRRRQPDAAGMRTGRSSRRRSASGATSSARSRSRRRSRTRRRSSAPPSEAGRTYAVMQNRRFEHGIRTLRDGLAAGRIGSVTMLACDFFKAPHFGGFRDAMESPLLLDMAIHQFDQARFLVGVDPVAVSCHEFNPAGSWYAGRAAAVCTFELADGSVFSYRGSWSAEGFGTSWNGSWRVVGTAGTALWDGEGDPVAEIAHAPEEPELLYPVEHAEWERTWDGPTGHAGCLDEMLAALAEGRPARD